MGGKRIDWDALLSVYVAINRQRDLTPAEQASLDDIVARKQNAERTARYRARNTDKVLTSQRKRREAHPDHVREIHRRSNEKNSLSRKVKAQRWREQNREHIAAYNRARKAKS